MAGVFYCLMSLCQVKINCQNVLTVNRFTAILVPDKLHKVCDILTKQID